MAWTPFLLCIIIRMLNSNRSGSLAPPLRRAGEGEHAEESGDTAIQSIALSTGLSVPIKAGTIPKF